MILRDPLPSLLHGVSSFVSGELGLHFPGNRHRELERAVEAAAKELGFEDGEAFARKIVEGGLPQDQMTVFTDHLTIGETYFLRDQAFFDALEQVILPGLLAGRGTESPPVRIWSAGCSTGEEPYSVAMTAHRCQTGNPRASTSILATDVNTRFLERASKGVYGEWSFRRTPDWVKDRYFHETGKGSYRIATRIRDMVTFSRLNLKDAAASAGPFHPQKMDIILCRNVLMYFDRATREEILARMVQTLAVDGWLFVSSTEIAIIDHPGLTKVRFPGLFCFRSGGEDVGSRGVYKEEPRPVRATKSLSPPGQAPAGGTSRKRATPPPPRREPRRPRAASESAPPGPEPLAAAKKLFDKGEFQEVIALLAPSPQSEAEGALPWSGDPGLPALLSRSHANLGLLDEALRWCEVALRVDGSSASHHLLLADIHQEMGNLDSSRAALRRALYLEPDSIMGRFRMGMTSRRAGRSVDADRWFSGMLDLLAPLDPDAIVADSDGRTASELRELVESLLTEVGG